MPIYEYDCPGCGRLFDKRLPMTEADQAVCPHCGSTHPKRRLSRVAIKGTAKMSGGMALPASGGT